MRRNSPISPSRSGFENRSTSNPCDGGYFQGCRAKGSHRAGRRSDAGGSENRSHRGRDLVPGLAHTLGLPDASCEWLDVLPSPVPIEVLCLPADLLAGRQAAIVVMSHDPCHRCLRSPIPCLNECKRAPVTNSSVGPLERDEIVNRSRRPFRPSLSGPLTSSTDMKTRRVSPSSHLPGPPPG